ncbi:dockerin type I repeat-containing protein [Ruminococcus flavefaciens]|uniref:dockerin type I repeat-containing protein n=1 Tax=Ruminococcus flavefaciens TaxID=1265 RepID=UPI00048E54E4|nr:dockerin type I repeat-containing protein [Ruminococcus flavefaciens]
MKKMFNALLAASMLTSFAAVPITVIAAASPLPAIQTEEKTYEAEKITDLDTIKNMINDFTAESKIGLKVIAKEKISDKYADKYVYLRWNTENASDYDKFGEFLWKNNIDDKLLEFIPFDTDGEENELNRISELLYYYVKDNNIPATVFGVDPDFIENKVTVEYYWKNEDVTEQIKAFLAENNIDTNLVSFAVEEAQAVDTILKLTVVEINNDTLILMPDKDSFISKNYSRFALPTKYLDNIEPSVGMKLDIDYGAGSGILSTYPAKFSNVKSVTVLSETAEIVKGDANLDDQADMADVVLIMQALANPNKYGENGSNLNHLTGLGKLNADIDGDGLTVGDAQALQKILLGL